MTKLKPATQLKSALLLGAAALVTAASAQSAQKSSPIKLTATTMLVTTTTDANGKTVEKLSDAANKGVLPSNTLEMGQKIENVSTTNVTGVTLNMPVSPAVTFMSQKCDAPATAVFSIDGKTFANPLKKTVTVNGVSKEVTVEPSEYKFVRWTLPSVKAGAVFNCAMRVKVK